MRLVLLSVAVSTLAILAGCATPDTRIADNQAAFAKYPPEVQQKIRAGRVEPGFTGEMVVMSLGEPARKFLRKTAAGDTEVWSYHDNRPRFSFGLGVASAGRSSAVGGGVGVTTGGDDPEEKVRVEFRDGVVTAVDLLRK